MSASHSVPPPSPIAIVGVGALFPGSSDATGFWRDILAGRDLIGDVPPGHWLVEDYFDADPSAPDRTYARRGGFLDPVGFDALGFGVPPSTLPATDTAQLLALIVAQSVLRDAARERFEAMDRSRISVILGVTSAQELLFSMVSRLQRPVWVKSLREAGLPEDEVQAACDRIAAHYVPWQEATFPGLLGNVVAGRIANRLNLGGTNCVTDAACASALSAMSMAVNELQLGHSDLVISGGVDTLNDIFMYMCFSKTPALSPSGDCRPFSDRADGTMLGEGLGMVALKRLADAERDGDRVYAVLRGLGTSSDGRSKSVYAPVPEGQAQALRRAYELAGYGPDTVELMEAHGTGTKAGDVAEFEGLRQVFGAAAPERRQWCALGSVKSQIGHTKAAAGAAGLFKAVMALHHKVLPPTIKVDAPNPKLALGTSPFHLNTQARPWIRGGDHPRRASVSAFGFGGSNFHATLEEYTGPARAERLPVHGHELVVLAADSAAALARDARALAAGDESLERIARRTQRDWRAGRLARLAVVAADRGQLSSRLAAAADRIDANPLAAFVLPDGTAYGVGAAEGGLALLFPGQGSQRLQMGAGLAMHFPPARAVWDRAADLGLAPDRALHEVVFPPARFSADDTAADGARLTRTEWAQPALGAASAATLALLDACGVRADAVAGHSFGEIVALHAAGAFDADAMLRVARRRGELMADAASTPGAMCALALPVAEVRELVASTGAEVVVANHNAPRQVVVSGALAGIETFERALEARGVAFRRLPVASGFHSPVVAGCCAPFADFLAGVEVVAPKIPVWSNAGAVPHADDPDAVRAALAAQVASPVRFVEMVEAMHAGGIRTFVEVGPGGVLTGLVDAILENRPHAAIATDRRGRDGVESLLLALARLAAADAVPRLDRLFADVREPAPPAEHTRPLTPISGSNVGKPYPPPGGAAALPPPNPPRPAASVAPAPTAPAPAAAPVDTVAAAGPAATPRAPEARPVPPASGTPMTAPTPLPPASTPPAGDAWLQAFQQSQAQLAAAHLAWQQAMASSHASFLQVAETAMQGLAALAGVPQAEPPAVPAAAAAPVVVAPVASVPHAAPVAPAAVAPTMPATSPVPAPAAVAPTATSPLPAPAAMSAAAPSGPATPDLTALMLSVVAEKTGYPADMLDPAMDLEGDLGVDSIKRVEILAAVEERAPGLPKLDRARMSGLHTLAEIVGYLQGEVAAAPAATPAPPVAAPARPGQAPAAPGASAAPAAPAAPAVDLTALMLSVVAEKTGYPADMLDPAMDLEGDLGVDSIKRVEILAAIEERAPGLPKLDRARMSGLHTLAEIVGYLQGEATPVATAPPDPQTSTGPVPAANGTATAADAAADDASPAPPALGRYRLERVAAPPTGFAQPGLDGSVPVWVLGEATLAGAVAAELCRRGADARATTTLPADARACIHLGGLADVDGIDAAIAINHAVFAAARTLAGQLADGAGLFVTVQDTGGDFGIAVDGASRAGDGARAWLAGAPALVKTAALEWPRAALKAIDLARAGRTPAQLAAAITDELFSGGGEIEVALAADGSRSTLRSVAAKAGAGESVVGAGDVVVVSGGARGVTAGCVVEWARRVPARFVLLGRTALADEPACCAGVDDEASLKRALLEQARADGAAPTPGELLARVRAVQGNREVRRTLAAIAAAGAQARYEAVDVTDAAALAAMLARVRADWAPVAAVVHAAGVLADRRLAEKTDAQFADVFSTKVDGLRALLDATRTDPLKLLAVFSSVSARCGNTGQADYAMANEVLAKVALAEARARPGLVAKSFGWGPWEGGMVNPALHARFAALGVPMIPLDGGARLFADELSAARRDEVELVLGGEPRPEALLSEGAGEREQALVVDVARGSHAWLEGHAIDGQPVVPLVLAAEWLTRAARSFRPGFAQAVLHDLRVLRGIRLRGFENGGDRFVIAATPLPALPGVQLALTIRDRDGHLNYRARVELLRDPAPAEAPAAAPVALEPWGGEPLYRDLLFHRGRFELIERLDGISDDGIAGTLRGVDAAGWDGDAWRLDVAALDGGLQLAVLIGNRLLGGPNLPTGIDRLRSYAPAPVSGLLSATAYRRALGPSSLTTDIVLTDGSGRRVAELVGVHNHALAQA